MSKPTGESSDPAQEIVVDVADMVATIRLNRPHRRNALSSSVIATLPVAVSQAARRDDVRVMIITGTDPAFCAGLDLSELGSTGDNLGLPADPPYPWPWDSAGKPVIGAINGPAVTGGFELAVHCDILIASERARFADTHARIGQVPGAGLTVNLPRLVGQARAKEMSFTGNFISAQTALEWGIVSHVVPHEELMNTARGLAADIVGNDPEAVVEVSRMYRAAEELPYAQALELEAALARQWQAAHHDPAVVAERRAGVLARAHGQLGRLATEGAQA
jgi:enoyl-CoA hydratase/carnithine racemase